MFIQMDAHMHGAHIFRSVSIFIWNTFYVLYLGETFHATRNGRISCSTYSIVTGYDNVLANSNYTPTHTHTHVSVYMYVLNAYSCRDQTGGSQLLRSRFM